ncbi:hypothetical protein MHBO_004702 [Bonamia ostreae]|uniref:Uncharacterized protein n=1 Tax=Bonamia ostreae TaxID=126728 RepID=A0ABV2AU19_9EUKA
MCGAKLQIFGFSEAQFCKVYCRGKKLTDYLTSFDQIDSTPVLYCDYSDGSWKSNRQLNRSCLRNKVRHIVLPNGKSLSERNLKSIDDDSFYKVAIFTFQ